MTRTLVGRFGKTPEKARYREDATREFFPEAIVENYVHLVGEMKNHPKDRHVLAAAIACSADYLITFNFKDFVSPSIEIQGVPVIGPSTFLKQLTVIDRTVVDQRLSSEQAAAVGFCIDDLLERLAGSVPGSVPSFVSFPQNRSGEFWGSC